MNGNLLTTHNWFCRWGQTVYWQAFSSDNTALPHDFSDEIISNLYRRGKKTVCRHRIPGNGDWMLPAAYPDCFKFELHKLTP